MTVDAARVDACATWVGSQSGSAIILGMLREPQGKIARRAGLRPGGLAIVEDVRAPVMEALWEARAKWEAVKLHVLRLEYLEGQSDWSSRPSAFGRLLLQKPQ